MRKYIPVLVILALTVSLALKSVRYGNSVPIEHESSIAHDLARLLKPLGWVETIPSDGATHAVFQTYQYAKPGCPNRLSVAVLGNNSELESFARISMGGDVGFFQSGRFVKSQNALQLQIAEAGFQMSAALGVGQHRWIPVLAISPMPPDGDRDCTPPSKKHWQDLGSHPAN